MDTLYDQPVRPEQESLEDFYSRNRLINGDASQGLEGWETSQVENVPGWGGNVFKVLPGGHMKQSLVRTGSQPPDFRVSGVFLPDDTIDPIGAANIFRGEMTVAYAEEESSTVWVPVVEPLAEYYEDMEDD